MEKRNYTHIQELLPEIKAMLAEGKTQREVAEHYGFKDKYSESWKQGLFHARKEGHEKIVRPEILLQSRLTKSSV